MDKISQILKLENMITASIVHYGVKTFDVNLEPSDFKFPLNKEIFEKAKELEEANLKVDIVNLYSYGITDQQYMMDLFHEPLTTSIGTAVSRLRYLLIQERVQGLLQNKLNSNDVEINNLIVELDKLNTQIQSDKSITDLATEVFEELLSKKDSGVFKSGFNQLDFLTGGFVGGDSIVIAAKTSFGKTSMALSILYKQCIEGNHKGLILTTEMTDKQLLNRLICMHTGISQRKLRSGELEEKDISEIQQFLDLYTKKYLKIIHASHLSTAKLKTTVKKHMRDGIEAVFIDYLQKLSAKAESREREVSLISETCKEVAIANNVPVFILSQLNRKATYENRKPTLEDLRESGAIENDADFVFFIHRERKMDDEPTAKTEILLEKNRNGITGEFEIVFDKQKSKFIDKIELF